MDKKGLFWVLSAKSLQKHLDSNNNIVILRKKRLKKHPILKKNSPSWKVEKMAILQIVYHIINPTFFNFLKYNIL